MHVKYLSLILVLTISSGVSNNSIASEKDAWLALRDGKAVAIMRLRLLQMVGLKATRLEMNAKTNGIYQMMVVISLRKSANFFVRMALPTQTYLAALTAVALILELYLDLKNPWH